MSTVISNDMKIILLIFFSGLLTHSYAFTENEKKIMGKIGYAQFFIVENIILMAGDNCSTQVSPEVKKAKKDAVDCIGDIPILRSFCASLVNDWFKCVKPLIRKLEECNQNVVLEGAIDASVRTTFSQADFICKSDTAHLLELANPCFLKSLESEEPCVDKFVVDVQSVFMTQKKLTDKFCKASSELENCVTSTIEESCPNKITINTIRGIYNATVKPCKKKIQ